MSKVKHQKQSFNPFEKLLELMTSLKSKSGLNPNPTDFVKRMRAIDKIATKRLLWDSQLQGTYRR